ncbi:hypothetical protein OMK64_18295 [Cellulomonas fimi]|uniref:TadE family type IV pilus minor pilin n=1 Tax=Cellulomonas fimi TaxID=1708 RepID=UPI00234C0EC9|nr:TadE family type IV pilus minor pilin [Cellulomonas fimi]MDC7123486.1 hypothetical protein [Cellulomonas fimi]
MAQQRPAGRRRASLAVSHGAGLRARLSRARRQRVSLAVGRGAGLRARLSHARRRCARLADNHRTGVCVPVKDAGSVTAELAVGLPVVILLLVVVFAVVGAGLTRAQCLDGARAGARALALGESSAEAVATARRVAGDGSRVRTSRDGEWVTVVVEASVPVGGLRLGPLTARGSASARVEP